MKILWPKRHKGGESSSLNKILRVQVYHRSRLRLHLNALATVA